MSDLKIYAGIYEWGGKNAVVGFILILAGVCMTASLLMWRTARKLREPSPDESTS
jgi:hypothetical protein